MAEHFVPLKVAAIIPETDDANSIVFDVPPELAGQFRFKAGQHLTLRTTIGGEEVRRQVRHHEPVVRRAVPEPGTLLRTRHVGAPLSP